MSGAEVCVSDSGATQPAPELRGKGGGRVYSEEPERGSEDSKPHSRLRRSLWQEEARRGSAAATAATQRALSCRAKRRAQGRLRRCVWRLRESARARAFPSAPSAAFHSSPLAAVAGAGSPPESAPGSPRKERRRERVGRREEPRDSRGPAGERPGGRWSPADAPGGTCCVSFSRWIYRAGEGRADAGGELRGLPWLVVFLFLPFLAFGPFPAADGGGGGEEVATGARRRRQD